MTKERHDKWKETRLGRANASFNDYLAWRAERFRAPGRWKFFVLFLGIWLLIVAFRNL